jgi:hypothetical protein
MGANLTGDGATLRVWAPGAQHVYLALNGAGGYEPKPEDELVKDPATEACRLERRAILVRAQPLPRRRRAAAHGQCGSRDRRRPAPPRHASLRAAHHPSMSLLVFARDLGD